MPETVFQAFRLALHFLVLGDPTDIAPLVENKATLQELEDLRRALFLLKSRNIDGKEADFGQRMGLRAQTTIDELDKVITRMTP